MSDQSSPHIPVMLHESLELLNITPGKTWIDATAGAGGHLAALLEQAGPGATVIGVDQDTYSLESLHEKLTPNPFPAQLKLIHNNFRNIDEILAEAGLTTIAGGILADLGVSSMQLDQAERGFSFLKEGPLDMRMNPAARTTAADLVNSLPEKQLADIIFKYGEERLSRQIARKIVESRPLQSTADLTRVVSQVVGRHRHGRKSADQSHPATRTFQALRIAVNDELQAIEDFLRASIRVLEPGARLVVITFHSLEDRIVKQIFREAAASCVCPPRQPICTCSKKQDLRILTPKPLLPDQKEILANPRSRSAKLRAGEKVS